MENIKKPNILVPDGFELKFNASTNRWALYPIEGYSSKFIAKKTFIKSNRSVNSVNSNNDKKKNTNLTAARSVKNDEFYTRLEDICNEVKYYKDFFKDKIVYCPCDKAFNNGRSNFVNYFISKFHILGIKKLICSMYNPNGRGKLEIVNTTNINGVAWEYNGEYPDDIIVDESLIETKLLNGNGSFDSYECKKLMQECDIVVTNPPFSLFRDFISQIMAFNKKFLIIGNMNAITYKEIFSLIKNNEMWLGISSPKVFEVPIDEIENEKIQFKEVDGKIYQKFGNIVWYTNLCHTKRIEHIYLNKKYNEETYPKYDNYEAIEVSRVENIPMDYEDVMGVPISFLDKYCPEQFEIVGLMSGAKGDNLTNGNDGRPKFYINNKGVYARLLIKRIINN